MTDLKLDPERLAILETARHEANRKAMSAHHVVADLAGRLKALEKGEVADAQLALDGAPQFGNSAVAAARERVERAQATADAMRAKLTVAKAEKQKLGEAFHAAARLHERCREFARQNGLDVSAPMDRGEELQTAAITHLAPQEATP